MAQNVTDPKLDRMEQQLGRLEQQLGRMERTINHLSEMIAKALIDGATRQAPFAPSAAPSYPAAVNTTTTARPLADTYVDTFGLSKLTVKQHGVVQMLIDGRSNADIAMRFGVKINTVKTYLRTIFQRFGVGSRNEVYAKVGMVIRDMPDELYLATSKGLPKDWHTTYDSHGYERRDQDPHWTRYSRDEPKMVSAGAGSPYEPVPE